ncbi:MAG TPA: cobalt-precorrin-6A reductase [Candidatus Sericytochromatia bacterium]
MTLKNAGDFPNPFGVAPPTGTLKPFSCGDATRFFCASSTAYARERIWLIGGTQESRELAIALSQTNLPCTITVTTEPARSLYPSASNLRVLVTRLDINQLEKFITDEKIGAILDASHPYAVEISRGAIASANQLQIPYLRYERLSVDTAKNSSQIIQLDSFNTLINKDYLQGQRVLLILGYRPLPLFYHWQQKASLFARILPSVTAMNAALAAGFTPERIIALRPPVSANLERALWEQWQISLVVTKASGTPGGEDIKRMVAAELGIPLIVINRPKVDYPQQTSSLSAALEFCRQHLNN